MFLNLHQPSWWWPDHFGINWFLPRCLLSSGIPSHPPHLLKMANEVFLLQTEVSRGEFGTQQCGQFAQRDFFFIESFGDCKSVLCNSCMYLMFFKYSVSLSGIFATHIKQLLLSPKQFYLLRAFLGNDIPLFPHFSVSLYSSPISKRLVRVQIWTKRSCF